VAGVTPRDLARVRQELVVRAAVILFIIAFNELFGIGPNAPHDPSLRALGIVGLLFNVAYYPIARTGWHLRAQAYVRMLIDVTLVTTGLYDAGGLAAAQDLIVYLVIPVYTALMFSSVASLVATGYSVLSYLAIVEAQKLGWLPTSRPPLPNAAGIAAFNLSMVTIVGVMAAWLGAEYRKSRRQVTALNRELERAHDASMRLSGEIQRSSRLYALGEVVAGVTHEIRNVLMAAMSHNALLSRKLRDPDPELQRHVEQVEHSLTTAARIIGNVLETARQPSNERVRVIVPDIARRVVDLKAYDVRRDGVTLRAEFPPNFPAIVAVPFQLEQVLLNLVSNAHDALRGQPNGVITITGAAGPGRAVIEVRDNGPGIAADVLPRIFEPFYTTKSSGTGLGLAISAGIARDAGGELTASNGRDGGAVFRLALPVAA